MSTRWTLAVLAACTAGPLALVAGLLTLAPDSDLQAELNAPVVQPLAEREVYFDTEAIATGIMSPSVEVPAGTTEGTVTSLEIAPGDTVTTGTVIAKVDGLAVTAYHSSQAFYRPLSFGAKGWDVTLLQRLTPRLGGPKLPKTGEFRTQTTAAVKTLERERGVEKPTGIFDPGWLVRIPQPEVTVSELSLQVGVPFPALGTTVFKTATELTGVNISAAGFSGPDGNYVFAVDGATYPLQYQDGSWVLDDPDPWQQLLTDTEPRTGIVRLQDPVPLITVPPAALLAGQSGTCVLTMMGDRPQAVPAEVVVEDLGVAAINTDLPLGSGVVTNPVQAFPELSCP